MNYKYYVCSYITHINRYGVTKSRIITHHINTNFKCNTIKGIKKLEEIMKEEVMKNDVRIEKIESFIIISIIELEDDEP